MKHNIQRASKLGDLSVQDKAFTLLKSVIKKQKLLRINVQRVKLLHAQNLKRHSLSFLFKEVQQVRMLEVAAEYHFKQNFLKFREKLSKRKLARK